MTLSRHRELRADLPLIPRAFLPWRCGEAAAHLSEGTLRWMGYLCVSIQLGTVFGTNFGVGLEPFRGVGGLIRTMALCVAAASAVLLPAVALLVLSLHQLCGALAGRSPWLWSAWRAAIVASASLTGPVLVWALARSLSLAAQPTVKFVGTGKPGWLAALSFNLDLRASALLFFLAWFGVWARARVISAREMRRRPKLVCRSCGYSLEGLKSGRCPECGRLDGWPGL